MRLGDILAPLCNLLESQSIPYAVIGGYAVAVWGQIRATRDIDILCDDFHLESLKAALSTSELQWEHHRGDPDDPIRHVIRVRVPPNAGVEEIEILAGIADAPPDITSRTRPANLDDLQLQIASPEDMVILKLLAGSPLDRQDAISIVRANIHTLDRALLAQICPPRLQNALRDLIAENSASP